MCWDFHPEPGAGQGRNGGLTGKQGEECCIRIVIAGEDLRKTLLKNESQIITLNRYRTRVKKWKKMWEEEELNGIAVPQDRERPMQDFELLVAGEWEQATSS